MNRTSTIAAIATPPGRGGIAIVRISGPLARSIGERITQKDLTARMAHYGPLWSTDQRIIDYGISLFFQGPHSFTGEDILEFHGHGGEVVIGQILEQVCALGATPAEPGEFSYRAYMNGKIDLAQAEAISDLIAASSAQAAACAVASLQGDFSKAIHQVMNQVTALRIQIEAALDFEDEAPDCFCHGQLDNTLATIKARLERILASAKTGHLLREGMTLAIVGRPNVGKSSLLNQLLGDDRAIVSSIAGTTRDSLHECLHLDGLPVHLVDTAGLRSSDNPIEQEGIKRTARAMEKAQHILLVSDAANESSIDPQHLWPQSVVPCPKRASLIVVKNKIDISKQPAHVETGGDVPVVWLSAKTGLGVDGLKNTLKRVMGYENGEGHFMARSRHLKAIASALQALQRASQQFHAGAPELLAHECRLAHDVLGTITGRMTADDLLGEIFQQFCIGK